MRSLNPGATPPIDEAAYTSAYPYYAELCAISELRKRPGFGVKLRSGIGGHCLLYLNGVRLDRSAGYPVLELCPPDEEPGKSGAGISVNSHYKNANWVACEGANFLWRGALEPGERLTRAGYARTQEAAKASGMLNGVEFHEHLFKDKPAGMSDLDFMVEISIATDYAICFGRDAYRARVPLDASRMQAILDYLNALNAPYRQGERDYTWRLFNDNCVHVAHNALAQAGIWAPWPTGQRAALAMFRFPVPKNGFVNLLRRTNDLPLDDPQKLFRDRAVRRDFIRTGALPTAPGALAIIESSIQDNEIYDTHKLRLIFYDDPFWGPYRFRFKRIVSEPRYFDLKANLQHFQMMYRKARIGIGHMQSASAEQTRFNARYADYIAAMEERLRSSAPAQKLVETVS